MDKESQNNTTLVGLSFPIAIVVVQIFERNQELGLNGFGPTSGITEDSLYLTGELQLFDGLTILAQLVFSRGFFGHKQRQIGAGEMRRFNLKPTRSPHEP